MSRLRYSRDGAKAEAIRRAEAFVAERPDRDELRLRGAFANPLVPPSKASKHPVAWLVLFAPLPPEGGVIDGGELFVVANLEASWWTYTGGCEDVPNSFFALNVRRWPAAPSLCVIPLAILPARLG